jgi:predicted porin
MKKLIVLATLAALPAAAMADVTISGNLAVVTVNSKVDGQASQNDMGRNAGQIVFAGSDDLGNGLKSIWQVANRVDPAGDESGAKAQWGNRDTFVGVKGSFGTVKLGLNSNPTNSGVGAAADVFTELAVDGGDDGSYKAGEARYKHSIRFDAPEVAGLKVSVAHGIKEAGTTDLQKHATGLGVTYSVAGVELGYASDSRKDGSVVGKTDRNDQFSASGAFGDVGVAFGYAKTKTAQAAGGFKKTAGYGVSATYAMGNVTPAIGYWKEQDSKTNGLKANDDFNVVTLGVNYALSKRTNAGVEFQKQSDKGSTTNTGVRKFAVYLGTSF